MKKIGDLGLFKSLHSFRVICIFKSYLLLFFQFGHKNLKLFRVIEVHIGCQGYQKNRLFMLKKVGALSLFGILPGFRVICIFMNYLLSFLHFVTLNPTF